MKQLCVTYKQNAITLRAGMPGDLVVFLRFLHNYHPARSSLQGIRQHIAARHGNPYTLYTYPVLCSKYRR